MLLLRECQVILGYRARRDSKPSEILVAVGYHAMVLNRDGTIRVFYIREGVEIQDDITYNEKRGRVSLQMLKRKVSEFECKKRGGRSNRKQFRRWG